MPKKQYYEYEGELAVIRYEPGRCIHAAECIKGLPGVFERHRRPWVDADQAAPDELVEAVARCPTGALRVVRRDGGPGEGESSANTARLVADGPIYLQGRLRLQAPDGTTGDEKRMALCRCGQSGNKPFCDNSHQAAAFEDPGRLGGSATASEATGAAGPVELVPAADGPIHFSGPLEIVAADGVGKQRKDKGYLCRCGASSNKPYCDGSHVAAGFRAD